MCFSSEHINGISYITLSGRLDTETAENLTEDFHRSFETGSGNSIILMHEVEYISSSMIRILLQFLKKHRSTNGDLKLVGLQPQIMRVMKIAGMDSLFNIHEDKESAMKSFQE